MKFTNACVDDLTVKASGGIIVIRQGKSGTIAVADTFTLSYGATESQPFSPSSSKDVVVVYSADVDGFEYLDHQSTTPFYYEMTKGFPMESDSTWIFPSSEVIASNASPVSEAPQQGGSSTSMEGFVAFILLFFIIVAIMIGIGLLGFAFKVFLAKKILS